MTEKNPLSDKQREQRRQAGSQKKTMTDAAMDQRSAALEKAHEHATGPVTPEGKAASARNNWRHGKYSAASRSQDWFKTVMGKPCQSTCPQYPCSLVEQGQTQPGGDCLDKRVFVQSFDAIITTLQTGELENMHGLLASKVAGALQILEQMRQAVSDKLTVEKALYSKSGELLGHETVLNPLLMSYIKMLEKMGINLPELLATPRAKAKDDNDKDGNDNLGDFLDGFFDRFGTKRAGRVFDNDEDSET